MDLIHADFGDLTCEGLIDVWPTYMIEWLHDHHLATRPIAGIVYNKLLFRDKGAVRDIIRSEYIRRGITSEFDATWTRYKNKAEKYTSRSSSQLEDIKQE